MNAFHEHYLLNGAARLSFENNCIFISICPEHQTFVFFDQIQFRIVVKVDSEL